MPKKFSFLWIVLIFGHVYCTYSKKKHKKNNSKKPNSEKESSTRKCLYYKKNIYKAEIHGKESLQQRNPSVESLDNCFRPMLDCQIVQTTPELNHSIEHSLVKEKMREEIIKKEISPSSCETTEQSACNLKESSLVNAKEIKKPT